MRKGMNHFKNVLYWSVGIIAIALIAFIVTFIIYSRNLNKSITEPKISEIIQENTEEELESASTEMGKTVEESQTQNSNTTQNEIKNQENKNNSISNNETKTQTKIKKTEETKSTPDPTFIKPVEGEMVKEFSKDNLIYSETLDEWVTHNGVDIKADKATIVKAACDGKVTAIKNDPRYGITIIIEHDNGYETRYSNLLTAEFVNVGEKVTQGQTIGTVGNSATFEVLDDPHLHFEILKNSEYLDPNLLMK